MGMVAKIFTDSLMLYVWKIVHEAVTFQKEKVSKAAADKLL